MKILAKYQNGNLVTTIYEDGTRVRETEDDQFIPSFAENMDVQVSNRCDNNCPMCYANCTKDGTHGELFGWKFLETLHPGTEMALNLNFPMHPDFIEFLRYLKFKQIITNVTINQNHFEKYEDIIKQLYDKNLIYGLGISLTHATEEFVERVKQYPNAVIHVINGIFNMNDYKILRDNNLKILILGYKNIGRGVQYKNTKSAKISYNQILLKNMLSNIIPRFAVVSFDNLAIEQLDVKNLLTDKEWEEFYGGDEGTFTYFLNLVDGYYAMNSLSDVHYPIGDLSVDEMFHNIRKECGHE